MEHDLVAVKVCVVGLWVRIGERLQPAFVARKVAQLHVRPQHLQKLLEGRCVPGIAHEFVLCELAPVHQHDAWEEGEGGQE